MTTFWPDPGKIRSALKELDLRSAQLYHSADLLDDPGDTPSDTTTVHLVDDGAVVVIEDSEFVRRSSYSSVSEQLPSETEPFLRIPVKDLDRDVESDTLPEGWSLTSKPYMDEYVEIDVATREKPQDIRWLAQDEFEALR